jgi:hypothetical protein
LDIKVSLIFVSPAEMEVKEEHTGSVAEPIAPGMTLPREKRKKKKEE